MLRLLLINLAIFVLLALIGVAGVEVYLRAENEHDRIAEFAALRETRPDIQFDLYKQIYRDVRTASYKYDHRRNVSVKLEKGYYEFTIRTNAEGLRETQDYDALPRSTIFLGDSVVEGSSVENAETMDSVFERLTGVTALNFGVASRGTFLEYKYLEGKYRPDYNADTIILGFCINDFSEAHYVRYFDEQFGNWFLLRYLDTGMDMQQGFLHRLSLVPMVGTSLRYLHEAWMESAIGKGLWRRLYELDAAPAPAKPWSAQEVTVEQRKLTALHLQLIRDFAASIDARLLVAIFPARSQLSVDYEPGERAQDVLIEILQANSIPHVDLYQQFRSAIAEDPDLDWYHDEVHFKKHGHHLVASILADQVSR